MQIAGPGINGGELYVNVNGVDADFYESSISSQERSSIININCDNGNLCTDNTIQGGYAEKSVILSCNGANSDCSNTELYCSDDMKITNTRAFCSVNCNKCQNMNVYSMEGTIDVDWNCNNIDTSCTNSKLYCGANQINDVSNLVWDSTNFEWIYQSGTCGFLTS